MQTTDPQKLKTCIRYLTVFFIVAIALSGITAFPLQTEMQWLTNHPGWVPYWAKDWVASVATGISSTAANYPFILYGTDWLAFAHIIIAMLFIGVFINPVKNRWTVEWAIICCILVFPLAFIAGPIRHIPFFHQLIDCGFGAVGLVPLLLLRSNIIALQKQSS